MISVTIGINAAPLQRHLRNMERVTGESAATLVRARSGLLARYLAESTQPVGEISTDPDGEIRVTALQPSPVGRISGSKKEIRQMGEKAVARDLANAYVTPAGVYRLLKAEHGDFIAADYWRLHKAGQWDKAAELAGKKLRYAPASRGAFNPAHHKSLRDARGRVQGRQRRMLITTGVDAYLKYRKLIKSRVGFAKSGWITAASAIPNSEVRGVPLWMRQGAPGVGTDGTRGTPDPYVRLTNRVQYISTAIRPHYVQRAVDRAASALAKDIKRRVAHFLKQTEARNGG